MMYTLYELTDVKVTRGAIFMMLVLPTLFYIYIRCIFGGLFPSSFCNYCFPGSTGKQDSFIICYK